MGLTASFQVCVRPGRDDHRVGAAAGYRTAGLCALSHPARRSPGRVPLRTIGTSKFQQQPVTPFWHSDGAAQAKRGRFNVG
eukprot:759715-Hanusia_phi.AAC.1